MADELDQKPSGSESPAPEAPTATPQRPKRKRSLKIDKDRVVAWVLDTHSQALDDRQDRLNRRIDRHEKLNGWLPEKEWPWDNCSNIWVPVMITAGRRMIAALTNAFKSVRPIVESRALQKRNKDKQENIDRLLDYQFFVENKGEAKLDEMATNFVYDEVLFVFVPYVREDQTVREIRILPPLDPAFDHVPQLILALKVIFPTLDNSTMDSKDSSGWVWQATYKEPDGSINAARVEFFDRDDGKIEAYITKEIRVFDGPAPQILDFEDIVYPVRSANLQPPNSANPNGASWVDQICKINLDSIRRRIDDGTYDLLDETDMAAIESSKSSVGSGQPEEEPKEAKDRQVGDQTNPTQYKRDDRQLIVRYGRWDVDGNGYEEDVIFWVFKDSRRLAKAAFLSELYPGTPVMRPIISKSFFPDTNRVAGDSFIGALEPIQDMMQTSMNQHFDWGTLTNMPFGFYRAASGMKPVEMLLEPGVMNPLDDPQRDIFFPQFASRGETFNINTMTLLQQFAERLAMLSDTAYGRVPTGRSAAFRTVGTTMALLGQIDVRTEEVLRRILCAVSEMFQLMHRLNRRYMPREKEIRLMGMAEEGQEPYQTIKAEETNADVNFDFKATMLNTNKQMVSQALQQTAALILSPLAIQAGIVTQEQVYNLMRDLCKSQDQDPDRYLKRPPKQIAGPKILAEEAFSAIVEGELPVGSPLEPTMEHLQKFIEFQKNPLYQAFSPLQLAAYQQWLMSVRAIAIEETRQQIMMQAAAQTLATQNAGQVGGVPTTISSNTGGNPPVQKNELIDEGMVQ